MDADSRQRGDDDLYCNLKLNLKSIMTDQSNKSKCLVRFHNCTNRNVLIYWLDFSGNPVKYPTLKQRQSILIDTYVSHMWFFKAESDDERSAQEHKKVLAIPQEALSSSCNATTYNYRPVCERDDRKERLWICPMCRYVAARYSRRPIKNPCHHYSGEARLSSSDLGVRSYSNYNSVGDFIYLCSENTHQDCHTRERRNIYLVESFYNLKERCFIEMNDRLKHMPRIAKLNLPMSVLRDYVQFADAFEKCKTVQ